MKPEIALMNWANACDRTGIRWYLFQETLLCANGYGSIPESVPCAQIAVHGRDLPDLVKYVFPALPKNMHLKKGNFANGSRELVLWEKKTPALRITVLYGVENEGEMADFNNRLRKMDRHVKGRTAWRLSLYNKLSRVFGKLYRKTFGRLTMHMVNNARNRGFDRLLACSRASREDAPYFCDCLTSKKGALYPAALFSGVTLLDSRNDDLLPEEAPQRLAQYPVFSGYREYLAQMYGDYENGLTDEIGCGLTVEEKEELRQHQARCFEALTFLQTLSQETGLRYRLIAGSVLGAVRHGGFIPWDDDIDIGVQIEDLEFFENTVKKHIGQRLPEGFTLEQSGADNPYPRMFSKICYNGRCCIDIWPLIPTYPEGRKAEYLWKFGKVFTKLHYQKIGHTVTKYQRTVKILSLFLSDKQVMKLARRNERRYAHKNTPSYINLYSIYTRQKETFQREWIEEEATALFNGLEVPVVAHTKLYLTHLYGNYMGFPLPWKRVSRHVARF